MMTICHCGSEFIPRRGNGTFCKACQYQNGLVRKRIAEARRKGITDIEAFLIEQQAKADARDAKRELLKQQYADHYSSQQKADS
jgi:hypothetical protein